MPHTRADRTVDPVRLSPHPPASSILDLAAAWSTTCERAEAELERMNAAVDAARDFWPARPAETVFRDPRTYEPCLPTSDWLSANGFKAAASRLQLWYDQCARIEAAFDVPALDQALATTDQIARDLAEEITAQPATTLAEAAAKFAVILATFITDGQEEPGPIFAFLADLERLASRAGSA